MPLTTTPSRRLLPKISDLFHTKCFTVNSQVSNTTVPENTSWNVAMQSSDVTLYTLTDDDVASATVRASGDKAINVHGPLLLYGQVRSRYGSWLFVYSTGTHSTIINVDGPLLLYGQVRVLALSVLHWNTQYNNQCPRTTAAVRPGMQQVWVLALCVLHRNTHITRLSLTAEHTAMNIKQVCV